MEGEVGLGVLVPVLGGRPGGGTSLRLRGTGLFWSEEKDVKVDERDCEEACWGSCESQGGAGGESSVRSMSSGAAPGV